MAYNVQRYLYSPSTAASQLRGFITSILEILRTIYSRSPSNSKRNYRTKIERGRCYYRTGVTSTHVVHARHVADYSLVFTAHRGEGSVGVPVDRVAPRRRYDPLGRSTVTSRAYPRAGWGGLFGEESF